MALYDDKRFILSHIRHSFITCDDTGMCETVMLNENTNRYPYESLYHHPFDYDSDCDILADTHSETSIEEFKFNDKSVNFFKDSELEYQSELLEEPGHSLDIMSDTYDRGIRRRSNTAQRLEKLRKERKFQSKTKVINWKSASEIVSITEDGNLIKVKRAVVNPSILTPEEISLLEYNEKENVYYETPEYRKYLYPLKALADEDEEIPDIDDLDPEVKKKLQTRKKSTLTLQIEQSPTARLNPFNEFTRFDGRVSEGNAFTKRIRIFFKVHEDDRQFQQADFTEILPDNISGINFGTNWIEIMVLKNARVCDLIGLICWHYTDLQLGPPLKPELSNYALKIAEENGDVDNDFPSLTFNDEIKRYGFPYLALVEIKTNLIVTVHIEPDGGFSQLTINSLNTSLQEIVDQVMKKRPQLRSKGSNSETIQTLDESYRLEHRASPGTGLNLSAKICDFVENSNKIDFCLISTSKIKELDNQSVCSEVDTNSKPISPQSFKNKADTLSAFGARSLSPSSLFIDDMNAKFQKKKEKTRDLKDWSSNMLDMMEAPIYQCFEVTAINKLYNTAIEMGISGAKVEITLKPNSRSPSANITEKFFSRFQPIKPMNINVEDVMECFPAHTSKQRRRAFKIVYYNGTDYKSLKFEGEPSTVDDILFKLQNVMKMGTSARRTEYLQMKSRKKGLSTKVYFKPKFSSASSDSSGSDETLADDLVFNVDESKSSAGKRESKFNLFKS